MQKVTQSEEGFKNEGRKRFEREGTGKTKPRCLWWGRSLKNAS